MSSSGDAAAAGVAGTVGSTVAVSRLAGAPDTAAVARTPEASASALAHTGFGSHSVDMRLAAAGG